MENYDVNVDHAKHSIGGDFGHTIRRLTHISMVVIPLLYYIHGESISSKLNMTQQELVSLICVSILMVEGMRLKMGIVIIGQREYESNQISALAWGTLSVSIALLVSPTNGNQGAKFGFVRNTNNFRTLCRRSSDGGSEKKDRRPEGGSYHWPSNILLYLVGVLALCRHPVDCIRCASANDRDRRTPANKGNR